MAEPGVSLVNSERARFVSMQILVSLWAHGTHFSLFVLFIQHCNIAGAPIKLRIHIHAVIPIQILRGDAFSMVKRADICVFVAGVEKYVDTRVSKHPSVVYSEQNKESLNPA